MPRISLLTLIAMALLIGSCCAPCEKPNLGDYPIQQGTRDWLSFANGENIIFKNESGETLVMTWSFLQEGVEELLENCDSEENCGVCCNSYQAGWVYTALTSENSLHAFSLTARKDFINASVNENRTAYDDYLTITYNNSLTCEWYQVPDELPTQSITLAGESFSGVYSCEDDSGDLDPNSVVAYYFKPGEGIVGFEEEDGTTWALQ